MHFFTGLAVYSLSTIFLSHGAQSVALGSFKKIPVREDQFEVSKIYYGKGQPMACALLALVTSTADVHMGFSLKNEDCHVGQWRYNSLNDGIDVTGVETAFIPLVDLGECA